MRIKISHGAFTFLLKFSNNAPQRALNFSVSLSSVHGSLNRALRLFSEPMALTVQMQTMPYQDDCAKELDLYYTRRVVKHLTVQNRRQSRSSICNPLTA
jgi:hypothetical protein